MTGDGVLGVSPEVVQRVSAAVSASADELISGLQALDAEVSGFVGSGWTGLSSGSFARSFWRWHEGAVQVHAGLAEMANLLNTAATAYRRQDESAAAALSGDAGRM
ncbi:WXG100 family type VII secretion target [Mycolicibacterium cosmeticum]|uniref:ESAT-6-like protein n=1 Tax=Mycolicibacterium cosmeticum TaxID=258533 RepID=W9AVM9_MYCCO|nr:WXG100 family type VII secretion target [Mycolicibacterium cosmeticum]TLH70360.1 WXG100 family type VII secretion target [Mycolicibacterium cosmeticum]CDO09889.1 WXG100 family type VII secretion target [Mycolicibacterium cosmeticum]